MSDNHRESEVQELVWAIVDQTISKKEMDRLKDLLRTDEVARETYVRFVRMHAKLAGILDECDETPASASATHEHVPSPKALLFRQKKKAGKSSDKKTR